MKLKDVMIIAVGAAIGYFTVRLIENAMATKPKNPSPINYSPVTM